MNKEQQIEEIEQFIYDYVDSKQTEKVYLFSSRVDELAKPFVHNKGVANALYNAGYRKVPDDAVILMPKERKEELKACNEKQAELETNIEILKIQNKNLGIAFDRLETENERLTERLKQVLLSIDTVKEMNAMCNIYEQRKQAVKEFAERLKIEATVENRLCVKEYDIGYNDGYSEAYYNFHKTIDELLSEYEQ